MMDSRRDAREWGFGVIGAGIGRISRGYGIGRSERGGGFVYGVCVQN